MWQNIKLISSGVWAFALPFLRQLLSAAGPVLMASALNVVKLIADNGLGRTGAEKRDMAFQAISAELRSKGFEIGVQVSVSAINAAIELAAQHLKEKTP